MGKITNTFYKILPKGIQQNIRCRYYLKRFENVTNSDEPEMLYLKTIIAKGNIVADIGANFGAYTKIMANLVEKNGSVFSFEPIPDTYNALNYNITKTDLTQVQPYNLGVSDKNAFVKMIIPDYKHGGQNFYEARITDNHERGISIQTVTLDDFLLPKISALHFIKIDVEGHEPQVLKGAKKLIERFKPILMIEINDDFTLPGSIGKEVVDFMKNMNYLMFYFDGSKLISAEKKQKGVNYFFLPQ